MGRLKSSRRSFVIGTVGGVLATLVFGVTANLVDDTEIVNFQDGNTLNAGQLNQNTIELRRAINDNFQLISAVNAPGYDYHEYMLATSYTSKNFTITYNFPPQAGDCTSVTRVFARRTVQPGNVLFIDRTQTRYLSDNTPCGSESIDTFQVTASALLYTERVRSGTDINGNPVNYTYTVLQDLPVLTSTMKMGSTWGSASNTTADSEGYSQTLFRVRTLLGEETMQLNINSVTNSYECLRFYTNLGSGSEEVSWHCKGLGMVKRIINGNVWTLVGIS